MHVEQFSSVNNLAVKHVHLTVVQVLYVYLTIVYGKNDGAHVRSMPKRSLFWQLGRHDPMLLSCPGKVQTGQRTALLPMLPKYGQPN